MPGRDRVSIEITRAVRAAARGEPVLAPAVAERLMDRARGIGDALTGREIEVLQLVARGLSNGEIAKELFVNATTAKAHLAHTYRKLGVSDEPPPTRPHQHASSSGWTTPRAGAPLDRVG
ncbi:MAG: response regulator transcription factor, partial [Gaiellaceae bacterium]